MSVSGGFIKLEKTFGEKSSDNDKYQFLSYLESKQFDYYQKR